MNAHDFMRKFANDYYKLTLDEILRADIVPITSLYGMDFVLINWCKNITNVGTWYYILFKEIYQDHVLEANYTTINAECSAGVDTFKDTDILQYIGDHMRFTPLEYGGYRSSLVSTLCDSLYGLFSRDFFIFLSWGGQ